MVRRVTDATDTAGALSELGIIAVSVRKAGDTGISIRRSLAERFASTTSRMISRIAGRADLVDTFRSLATTISVFSTTDTHWLFILIQAKGTVPITSSVIGRVTGSTARRNALA